MGLHLNPKKTRLTHTLTPVDGNVGFQFLGFHIRQYPAGKTHTGKVANQWGEKILGFQTLIKPGKEEIKNHMREIKQRLRKLWHRSQEDVIETLTPVIRGWTNYYKTVISSEVFNSCDRILYIQLASWAKRKHPTRGKQWIQKRYWRTIGNNHWVFASKAPDGMKRIRTHSMTHIQRFTKVKGTASPYDGNLLYWSQRLKTHPMMRGKLARLLQKQQGKCRWCELIFREGDLIEIDHIDGNHENDAPSNQAALHQHCHDERHTKPAKEWKYAAGINRN
jgi:RNA-directed DNA polymerase